ncbi:membrane protein [Bacteroidia bacterium]|nr:membrane protein [Bacteroidia bacterium]
MGLWVIPVSAQLDVRMSQYMFNGMVLNPAHTGEHETWNIQAIARLQWLGVSGAPNTQILSADGPIYSPASGIGVSIMRDEIGGLTNLGGYVNYAYRLRLNELNDRLCFGLAAGFVQNSYDSYDHNARNGFGGNIYDSPIDPTLINKNPAYLPDFKFGILYDMRDIFYVGLAANNLGSFLNIARTDSFSVVQTPILTLNAGGSITLNNNVALRPSLLYTQPVSRILPRAINVEESPSIKFFPPAGTLDVSVAAVFVDRFWIGATYRAGLGGGVSSVNAMAFSVEVWVTKALRIGYTYDLAVSGLSNMQSGSHEVSIGFTPEKKATRYKSARDF